GVGRMAIFLTGSHPADVCLPSNHRDQRDCCPQRRLPPALADKALGDPGAKQSDSRCPKEVRRDPERARQEERERILVLSVEENKKGAGQRKGDLGEKKIRQEDTL